jgi:hypothetical protein
MNEPTPTSLAGYQLLCASVIEEGDLLIPVWSLEPGEWLWAERSIGVSTDKDGYLMPRGSVFEEFRVYRKSEVAKHLDKGPETVPLKHGGALATDAKKRKDTPVFSGVLKYFPRALCAVAQCSLAGNRQHHPDKPLHWDMSKSTDEQDSLVRHLMDAGTFDTDGTRHSAKVAWRALAALERELIAADGLTT